MKVFFFVFVLECSPKECQVEFIWVMVQSNSQVCSVTTALCFDPSRGSVYTIQDS